jgi:HK97 family phage prohead protease
MQNTTNDIIIDRSQESVLPQSYDLQSFMKNPDLLYQHRQENVIGKVVSVNLTDKGLEIEAEVHKALNEKVFYAVKNGILRAFSIGFIGKNGVYDEKNDIWYWTDIELVEVSIVSVPDNQESLFSLIDAPCQNEGICLLSINNYKKKGMQMDNKKINVEEKAIRNSIISTTPWGDVDKTRLGEQLAELGKKSYIGEAYLIVGDYEKRSTWKFPHHELKGEDLVVNKNGVIAAWAALQGARNKPNISPKEKRDAARHLLRHYNEMKKQGLIEEVPQELKDMIKECGAKKKYQKN